MNKFLFGLFLLVGCTKLTPVDPSQLHSYLMPQFGMMPIKCRTLEVISCGAVLEGCVDAEGKLFKISCANNVVELE
jgi:hypothetical protein